MRERAEALPGGWFKAERLEQAGAQILAGTATGATMQNRPVQND